MVLSRRPVPLGWVEQVHKRADLIDDLHFAYGVRQMSCAARFSKYGPWIPSIDVRFMKTGTAVPPTAKTVTVPTARL